MIRYVLYNADTETARFGVEHGLVRSFEPTEPRLLPMQLKNASAEGFMAWLNERAIDLNVLQHRNLVHELFNTRDKLTLSLKTHMFSVSDTFTCFPEGEFMRRDMLCDPEGQAFVSRYILVSSDTSLRNATLHTPNVSTDGSFPKTWEYENGVWWLYKQQSSTATRCEVEISRALRKMGWDAAEYVYDGRYRKRVKSRNFVGAEEFFEPYASFRYAFEEPADDDETILRNMSSLGREVETAWKRILAADAFFMNTDRHMRNFGVIRSAKTGEVLRRAPNFDNNQAYLANPGGRYSSGMLKLFLKTADEEEREMIADLRKTVEGMDFFADILKTDR